MAQALFVGTPHEQGIYESFYLRAVSPDEPVGAWIRYTVHKRPGAAPKGSLWCTVFDAARGAPFMHKHTSSEVSAPHDGWLAVGPDGPHAHGTPPRPGAGEDGGQSGGSRIGPGRAQGSAGPARWSLRFSGSEPELRHLPHAWMYRTRLPRTKLTSPVPAGTFDGVIELPDRTIDVAGWPGMVGHNWGTEHAERWIWLHGIGFEQDPSAWIDVALGRVLVAGRLTPWLASGAISLEGRRVRIGGLMARGVSVTEGIERCSLTLPGQGAARVEAHLDVPARMSAGWRYADPVACTGDGEGHEHDVVNCSIASLTLNVRFASEAAQLLHTAHGAAYELGMRERDHGVPIAPFSDG